MYRAAVIVASDSRSSRKRVDTAGPAAQSALAEIGIDTICVDVVPDDIHLLASKLRKYCEREDIALVLTSGGTGLAPRDVTPEATRMVIEREVPGIPEFVRQRSMIITPRAALSRAIAGIYNRTLVVNLPGSPKAVTETIGFLSSVLPHALETVVGAASECSRNRE